MKSKKLGGVIQWQVNDGYLPSALSGQTSPLLLAVRDHVLQ